MHTVQPPLISLNQPYKADNYNTFGETAALPGCSTTPQGDTRFKKKPSLHWYQADCAAELALTVTWTELCTNPDAGCSLLQPQVAAAVFTP